MYLCVCVHYHREEDRLILVTCQQDGLAHATMEKIASCLGGRSASDVSCEGQWHVDS